jgi:hypothetical protein
MFTVVGQSVSFARDGVAGMQVGDYVMVYGSLAGSGSVDATAVELSPMMYVPGVSEVFVTGIPSSVDYTLGTVRIGELNVDYTPSLGGNTFDGMGAAITVFGTQPALGGTMLGDSVVDRTALFLRN